MLPRLLIEYLRNSSIFFMIINIKIMGRPARLCPRPPRLAQLAGELAMAGGSDFLK